MWRSSPAYREGQGVKRPAATGQSGGRHGAVLFRATQSSVLELACLQTPAPGCLPPMPGWGKSGCKLMKGFTQQYEVLVLGQQHLEPDQITSPQHLKQKPTLPTSPRSPRSVRLFT